MHGLVEHDRRAIRDYLSAVYEAERISASSSEETLDRLARHIRVSGEWPEGYDAALVHLPTRTASDLSLIHI